MNKIAFSTFPHLLASLLLVVFLTACSDQKNLQTANQKQSCTNEQSLLVDQNVAIKGPWPVGRVEVEIARGWLQSKLKTQVWYPAVMGSEQSLTPIRYDIRRFLPATDAAKVPESEDPYLYCNCYDQLPPDTSQGKFPVIVYIHGTGGFSEVAISQMTHWASRGFVVIAANHPNIQLSDILSKGMFSVLFARQASDLKQIVKEIHNPKQLKRFAPIIDNSRIGVIGHSAGAIALEKAAQLDGVQVIIPQAGNSQIRSGKDLQSIMVMGAYDDGVINYQGQVSSFNQSTANKKRLIGIANAGHMVFSEICGVKQAEGSIFAVAAKYDVKVPAIIKRFASDGCATDQIVPKTGTELINFVTTAAFEETLKCSTSATQQLNLAQSLFENIATFEQEFSPVATD